MTSRASSALSPLLDEHPEVVPGRPLPARGVQPRRRAHPAHARPVPALPRHRHHGQDGGTGRRLAPPPGPSAGRGPDGIVIEPDDAAGDPRWTLRYDQIDRARTVLVWGPTPRRPGSPAAATAAGEASRAEPRALQPRRTPDHERQLRLPGRPAADRQGQGHQRRHPARRPRQRAAWPPTSACPTRRGVAVVTVDPDTGEIRVYGQELDEDGNVIREWDDTPKDFGRIAAQTAKQVITQRIREAERDLKYEEYAGREGDIVTGIIQQSDNRYTLLDLGKVEALLPQAEQVPYERYEHGARLKAYIVEVRKTTKGPQIVVSRTHPGLIKRLFELEVPEISSGVVEIKAAAREPGHRTKIAVWSNDPNVDPVGACVGARGARVRMVTNELRGEKVDIVPFSDEPREFVMRALQPAKVKEVHLDDLTGTATVVVHDFQLSLAIGKEGQNARLAARLTGWRIDIKSETQIAEEEAYANQEWAEGEWVENDAGEMVWQPAEGGEAVSAGAVVARRGATRARRDGASRMATPAGRPRPRRPRRPRRPTGRRRERPRAGAPVGEEDNAVGPDRGAGPDPDLRRVPVPAPQPVNWCGWPAEPTGRWSSTGMLPGAAPGSARDRRPEGSTTSAWKRQPIGTPFTGPSRPRCQLSRGGRCEGPPRNVRT